MAPRLSKEDGELIDEILRNNPNSDANELAELFHTTYKSVSERRRKLFQRMRTGIDDRKKPGPKVFVHLLSHPFPFTATPS